MTLQEWQLPFLRTGSLFWPVAIAASTIFAICSTIFSLTHGIYEVFPFLYFLPIILFVYFYPGRGVIFTLLLSTAYLGLIYFFSGFNPQLVAVSTAWYVIFVTIGVVTSSFAEGLRAEERKYRSIFENSQAGIFTYDLPTLTITELNGKFARMLRYDRQDLAGRHIAAILPEQDEREAFVQEIRTHPQAGDVELHFISRDGIIRQFLVSASLAQNHSVICSVIDITERKLAERVISKAKEELEQRVNERTGELMRANEILTAEIQERKRFEAAISLANRKLNTLSSITRHDILNQVTAVVMYLSLAQESEKDPVILDHLNKVMQITHLIQKQIRFTRDYQNIGSSSPQWQDVAATVNSAVTDLDLKNVRVETDTGDLQVFADYLLEKVFYNLVDNSLRHGEKVTACRISYRKEGDGLVIVYEDDGAGIPAGAKEKIFRREYYRNTGYGLFLAQEILNITGMTIRETGEPGRGARFEIHVPKDGFRFGTPENEG